MSHFAGIDYDSGAIHIATVDEDTVVMAESAKIDLTFRDDDSFDRARRVRDLMPPRTSWRDAGVLAIGIELPFSRQRNSIVALSRVQGAILACLPRDILVLPLSPNSRDHGWKHLTVGKTNATKPEIKTWAIANGAPTRLEQDFYDAYCIARATALLWQRRHEGAAAA